jgi:hypothetical protein
VIAVVVVCFAVVSEDFIEFGLVVCAGGGFAFFEVQFAVLCVPGVDEGFYVGGVVELGEEVFGGDQGAGLEVGQFVVVTDEGIVLWDEGGAVVVDGFDDGSDHLIY